VITAAIASGVIGVHAHGLPRELFALARQRLYPARTAAAVNPDRAGVDRPIAVDTQHARRDGFVQQFQITFGGYQKSGSESP
jgi:hypothetical protein